MINKELTYHRDNRTQEQYETNITNAHKEEDLFQLAINPILLKRGFSIIKNGGDADRVIQTAAKKITAAPDFIITNNSTQIYIEYKLSNTKIDYLSPKMSSEKTLVKLDGLFVFSRLVFNDYVVIDPNNEEHLKDTEIKNNFLMGNKPCRYYNKTKLSTLSHSSLESVVDYILINKILTKV